MVMLQVGGSVLSVSRIPGWVPLRAYGSSGSPRCGPRMPRGTVRHLVDRQGVAESSQVQWCSVMSPLAGVSGDDGGTVATPTLVSGQVRGTVAMLRLTKGMGGALLPRSLLIEASSHHTAWMGRELTRGWIA